MTREVSRAVAEDRAPAVVEADDATRARWRRLDWFATPPWASRAGIEIAREIDENFGASVTWEPACGDAIMAKVLVDELNGGAVFASDIAPQGPDKGATHDFLSDPGQPSQPFAGECRWIFTNPPFAKAAEFVERGLRVASHGVAVLCRLSFLESVGRYDLHSRHLTDLAIFCERVPMQLGPWNPKCSTATAYAWFFYSKAGASESPRLHLIPPGTRARLSKPDDIRRFVVPTSGALL